MPLENKEQLDGARETGQVSRTGEELGAPPDGCMDKFLLIAAALVVCVVIVGVFSLTEHYHVNPTWAFLGLNSLLIVPVFVKDFRSQLKRPIFVAYLAVWAVLHGLVMVGLTFWIPFVYWPIFIIAELTIGILLANYLFDISPDGSGH